MRTIDDLVISKVFGATRSLPAFDMFFPTQRDSDAILVLHRMLGMKWQFMVTNTKKPFMAVFWRMNKPGLRPQKIRMREATEKSFGLAVSIAALRALKVPEAEIEAAMAVPA